MATIDELDFKLVIDDKDFDKQVQEVKRKAEEFNRSISQQLSIKKLDSIDKDDVENMQRWTEAIKKALEAKKQTGELTAKEYRTLKNLMSLESQMAINSEKEAQAAEKRASAKQREEATTKNLLAKQKESLEAARKISYESQAAAAQRTALAQQKVVTETQRTALAQQRVVTETQRTATAQSKATKEMQKAATEIQRQSLLQQKTATEVLRTAMAEERLKRAKENTNQVQTRHNRLLAETTSLITQYASIWGVSKLLKNIIQVTGEFELQQVTLRSILKDMEAADTIFEQIKGLAVQSPFTFKELVTYAKQLSAFSVPVRELYGTTKMLADVSAGLGVGMDRIILAYGQIRSASFLRGQEVRQLTEAGVPVLEELRKQFEAMGEVGITVGDVFDKISARMVPFKMIEKMFKDMTSEGGKFYKMQEVQAETLKGKISNLKDAFQIMFSEIGEKEAPAIKETIDGVRKLAQNYEEVGKEIVFLAKTYGALRLATLANQAVTGTLATSNSLLAKSFQKLWAVMLRNPYTTIVAALVAAIAILRRLTDSTTEMEKAISRITSKADAAIAKEVTELDALYTQMQLATEGTRAYNDARGKLYSRFSSQIDMLRQEGHELEATAGYYDLLKESIEDTTRARFREQAFANLGEAFNEEMAELYGKQNSLTPNSGLERFRENLELTEKEMTVLRGVINGMIEPEDIRNLEGYGKLWQKLKDIAGAKGGTPITYFDKLEELRDKADVIRENYRADYRSLDNLFTTIKEGQESQLDNLSTEAKLIRDVLKSFGIEHRDESMGLWYEDSETNHDKYLKMLRDRYAEINEQIANSGSIQKARIPSLQKEQKIIEAILKAMDLTADTDKKIGTSNDAVRSLQSQIATVERLKGVYNDLKALSLSDEDIKKFFADSFNFIPKDIRENFDFDNQLLKLVSDLEKLGDEGVQAANKIRENWGAKLANDMVAEMVKEVKARQDFEKRVQGYIEETMSKEEKINELEKQRADDLAKGNLTIEQATAINEHYDNEIQKVKDSLLDLTSIQLTDFWKQLTGENENSTFARLDALRLKAKALMDALTPANAIRNKDGKITGYNLKKGSNQDLFASLGIDNDEIQLTIAQVEALSKVMDKLFKKESEKSGIGALAKIVKEQGFKGFIDLLKGGDNNALTALKGASDDLAKIGGVFSELGEALGSDTLKSMGEMFSFIGDFGSKLASGDIIGAIGSIISVLTSWITQTARLKTAIAEAADEAERLNAQMQLESGSKGIFGANDLKRLSDAVTLMQKYGSLAAQFRNKAAGDITWKSGIFNLGRTSKSLAEVVNELGYDLFDAYGNLNSVALRAILETYEHLIDTNKEWMEDAIRYSEIYAEAMEQIDDVISALYGDVVDSATDAIVDQWAKASDAALDYADILQEVAKSYAKMIIKQGIIDKVFTPEVQERLKALSEAGDVSGGMALLAEKLEELNTIDWQKTLEPLEQYIRDTSGSSLANDIKGITEDTAQLLASYLNAIRADVSVSRISLTDIQVNTLRTAIASEGILNNLLSVMGAFSGGGQGLKVIVG